MELHHLSFQTLAHRIDLVMEETAEHYDGLCCSHVSVIMQREVWRHLQNTD